MPAPIPDHIHIAHSAEPNARRAFTQQAALDWQDFLAFRGRELAPGGRLVVLTLGVDDTGLPGFAGVMQALLAALHGLVDAGTLHPEEVARMAIPTVGRTEEEFRALFAPSGRFEGLSVERLETFTAEDQFWARYRHDGDAAALGASWAGFARAAVFPPWPQPWKAARTAGEPSTSSTPWSRRSPRIWPHHRSRWRFRWRRWSSSNATGPAEPAGANSAANSALPAGASAYRRSA